MYEKLASYWANFVRARPRASYELSIGVWYDSIGRRVVGQQWGTRWATFQVFAVEPI